jgi:hypothetical protein
MNPMSTHTEDIEFVLTVLRDELEKRNQDLIMGHWLPQQEKIIKHKIECIESSIEKIQSVFNLPPTN